MELIEKLKNHATKAFYRDKLDFFKRINLN